VYRDCVYRCVRVDDMAGLGRISLIRSCIIDYGSAFNDEIVCA
jgi:hypothetical protein